MLILFDRQWAKASVLDDMLETRVVVFSPFVLEVGGNLLARQKETGIWCEITWARCPGSGGKNVLIDLDLELGGKCQEAVGLSCGGHGKFAKGTRYVLRGLL